MSFLNNYEQDDQIPPLIPLKKTKANQIPVVAPTQNNPLSNEDTKNVLFESLSGTPSNNQSKKDDKNAMPVKKQPNAEKIEEIEKKAKEKISTVQKKDNHLKNIQHEKAKENEKNKFVIAQLLHSMNIKNLSEELYPLSNEALQKLLRGIEKEIEELNIEADKKERTLAINQNNLHLKKELETIRREIDHCCLIKQLYYEKMNYRNKIQTLEEDITGLRNENKELKIKVARGLEAIENYRQNLPSDNEKDLREKLNLCNIQLTQEKEMRQGLEKNIESIINNFKRLYDEAEVARQIVTKKLKEVEEKEKRIKKMKENEEEEGSEDPISPTRRVATLQVAEKDKLVGSYSQFNNYNQTIHRKGTITEQDFKKSTAPKTKAAYTKQKEERQKRNELYNQPMTLEDRIKKMKANQTAVTRIRDN